MNKQAINRGDVFYVENRTCDGAQPGIIISNNEINRKAERVTLIFCKIAPKEIKDTHVPVQSIGDESVAMCDSISSLPVQKLQSKICAVSEKEMQLIDENLADFLALDVSTEITKEDIIELIELEDIAECIKEKDVVDLGANTDAELVEKYEAEIEVLSDKLRENKALLSEYKDLLKTYKTMIPKTRTKA